MFTHGLTRPALWLAALGFSACLPLCAGAQTLKNPDISLVGDMRYLYRNDVAKDLAQTANTSFEFHELELNFAGYINPYVRADAYLSIEGLEGPVGIEEINATVVRGMPAQVRFGKYRIDIGKINTEHVHQWAWLEYPLMLRSFLGDEGAASTGINLRRLQGIGDTAVTLSLNAFRSDFFATDASAQAAADSTGSTATKIGYSGRLSAFRDLNDTNFLEAGGSYLYAQPDFNRDLIAQVAAVDVTYKWVPGIYKAAKLRAEGMLSHRDVQNDSTQVVSNVDALGAFAAAEVKFRRRFDTGGFFDWAQDATDSNMETTAFGAFFGIMPVEETARFSIVYRHETSDLYEGTNNSVTFQVLWSLGPHKPHAF
jgi:hypothetical protein